MTVIASRTYRWFVVALVCLGGLWAGGSAPADAHAVLTSSTPARGAVIAAPPSRVVLVFTEEIALSADAIRVLDPEGRRVDDARPVLEGANTYAIGLGGRPGRGTYTVAYQVVSADSHPVAGAFTFSVGAPSAATGTGASGVHDPDSGPVGWAYAGARFGAYLGMTALTGVVCFVLLCWTQGTSHRPLRRAVTTAWAVLVACTLTQLLLRGAYTGSGRVADLADVSLLADVLGTKAGVLLLGRLGLLAVGAAAWAWWCRSTTAGRAAGRNRVGLLGAAVTGTASAWTWAGAEHASAGPQPALAMPADVIHLLAAGAWIGGLGVLAFALKRVEALPADAVARFSRVAFVSVCALVATGLYQSWRQVGSLPALTDTRFGLLLLAKSAVVALLLCLGYVARRRTRAIAGAGTRTTAGHERGRPAWRGLRRGVAAEAALGLGVLAITTVLTTTEPARSAHTAAASPADVVVSVESAFDTGGPGGKGKADVVVDPGGVGPNAVHVTVVGPDGRLLDVPEIRATLTSSGGIGPLAVPLRRASEGHWTVSGFQVPTPGTWELALTVRSSDVDQITLRRPLDIRR
ncbi:copper resistance protein CopC [Streptomyces sp. NPDC093111]|uniref:copper resistance CopC/CopD family protein n=1 Tax=Streptomyces sp. NPDC093111 TaxID=3154978 RepID=UPI003443AEE9